MRSVKVPIRTIRRRTDNLLWKHWPRQVITIEHPGPRALFSYLHRPLIWKPTDNRFNRHSNYWESVQIARMIASYGYAVDAIDLFDSAFQPQAPYEVIFDTSTNLQRLCPLIPNAIKLYHMTGSYGRFQNAAEGRRAAQFEERTGVRYSLKRAVKDPEATDRSMQLADRCSLIGNLTTLSTFPEEVRSKTTLVTVSSSPGHIKPPSALVPASREFLWFFGAGAVHKGLDLVLEAFRRMPGSTLNVVGSVDWEKDFMEAYGGDLRGRANVRYHGSLDPSGERYRRVVERCLAFIAPSCSEGISPATTTVMQTGLYPIISRETGVTLPEGHGTYLESCTIDEIVQACQDVVSRSEYSLRKDIEACQTFALHRYSRDAFTSDMRSYLAAAIQRPNDL